MLTGHEDNRMATGLSGDHLDTRIKLYSTKRQTEILMGRICMEDIKQLLPIPDRLTAMIKFPSDDGRECFIDAVTEGWSVMYALLEDSSGGDIKICYIDPMGDWSIDSGEDILFVPTVYCPHCGQRMIPHAIYSDARSSQRYGCTCGAVLDRGKVLAIAEAQSE